jgi:fluoride ion exporter CrcB/FEX
MTLNTLNNATHDSFDLYSILLNTIGSILVGFGIGVYRHVAKMSKERSAYGLIIVFTIFCSVTFLLFTPLFEYRAWAKQLLVHSQ